MTEVIKQNSAYQDMPTITIVNNDKEATIGYDETMNQFFIEVDDTAMPHTLFDTLHGVLTILEDELDVIIDNKILYEFLGYC